MSGHDLSHDLVVDDFARVAGTTTRNVRAMQSSGLIAPPRMDGRTGYYGDGHLERLRAVLRLQRDGFSLAAIKALFDALEDGLTLEEVLGMGDPGPRRRPAATDDPYLSVDGNALRRRGRALVVVPSSFLAAS